MRRESGISAIVVVAAVAVLAAVGAGYYGFSNMATVDRLQNELNATRGDLDKVRADLKKATAVAEAASKDAKELKVETQRLTTERDAVRTSMENEQATGVRLRAELALAKDQISYFSSRSSKDIVRGMPKTATSQ